MCYVYFITDGLRIKIGIADNIKRRLHSLQTGNPRRLSVLKIIQYESRQEAENAESNFHYVFSNTRCFGEWFDKSPELCRFVGIDYEPPRDYEGEICELHKIISLLGKELDSQKNLSTFWHNMVNKQNEQINFWMNEAWQYHQDYVNLVISERRQKDA